MEREKPKSSDLGDVLGARPNGRARAPLVINRNGPRRDLFSGKPASKENLPSGIRPTKASLARAASAGVSPDQQSASFDVKSPVVRSQSSKTSSPATFSLKDAYRMAADAEDVAPGSPSPAPRPWRSMGGSGASKSLKSPTPGQGHGAFGSRRQRNGARQSIGSTDKFESGSQKDDNSDSDFDEKIKQFGKAQESSKRGIGQGQNGSPGASSPGGAKPWAVKSTSTDGWLKRVKSSPAKTDANHGAFGSQRDEPLASGPTPNKSFDFDIDADFTAADLLVSDSPPVKSGTGLGNIRQNTKLDEIRALEIEADLKYLGDPATGRLEVGSPGKEEQLENGSWPARRTNTKIDEIRAREAEASSRRAIANARLDEIREHNSETRPHSSSPEISLKPISTALAETVLSDDRIHPRKPVSTVIREELGEQISASPITVFRTADVDARRIIEEAGEEKHGSKASSQGNDRKFVSRGDSFDALRRLARATSSSPVPEQQVVTQVIPESVGQNVVKDDALDSAAVSERVGKDFRPFFSRRGRNAANSGDKPRVGFAGLQREQSTESDKSSKRSSIAQSETDPTERIERELQLFAPGENHSERGSVRAPSPESDREDVEETPKAARVDPLMQPTPRVTGAYVETPVTVKVERAETSAGPEIVELAQEKVDLDVSLPVRSRTLEISSRNPTQTSSAEGTRDRTRTKPRTATSRRARSLARLQSPLINSSRPPTVKDDLLEIQRNYQIEDSTLDDFDGFLDSQDLSPAKTTAEQVPGSEEEQVLIETKSEADDLMTEEKSSKAISRIGRSLESIRTARKGIERLEDEFSKAKDTGAKEKVPKSETPEPPPMHSTTHPDHIALTCPICLAQPSPDNMIAYVHLPVPRLWRRNPKFKLTFLGLTLFLFSLWYAAETTMCHFYCKPEFCYPGDPCIWSYEDPFWGYAIPVKLDQWTTGGAGRSLLQKARPEVADWVADLWDAATGTDMTTVDTRYYNVEKRRQHRRRLMKRGLIKPLAESPEDKAKYDAWARTRKARERVEAMREMGYEVEEEESMSADEKIKW